MALAMPVACDDPDQELQSMPCGAGSSETLKQTRQLLSIHAVSRQGQVSCRLPNLSWLHGLGIWQLAALGQEGHCSDIFAGFTAAAGCEAGVEPVQLHTAVLVHTWRRTSGI